MEGEATPAKRTRPQELGKEDNNEEVQPSQKERKTVEDEGGVI